uniref:CSON003704 protein n=1 Tax=Culicoides sonorensis TaxID=179676 RepID=A0A336JXE7_CULSO
MARMLIIFAMLALAVLASGKRIIHAVSRLTPHPNYNSNLLTNDIGLVQTSTTISFTTTVQPIALGSTSVGGGVTAVASGWGNTYTGGGAPTTLQYLNVSLKKISLNYMTYLKP